MIPGHGTCKQAKVTHGTKQNNNGDDGEDPLAGAGARGDPFVS